MKDIRMDQIGGNLDHNTRKKLLCINKECIEAVYHHLKKTVVKDVPNHVLQNVWDYMQTKSTPAAAKAKLMAMVRSGQFGEAKSQEIDEEVERELNLCMATKINKAIKSGELKPPKGDAFSKKMEHRMIK